MLSDSRNVLANHCVQPVFDYNLLVHLVALLVLEPATWQARRTFIMVRIQNVLGFDGKAYQRFLNDVDKELVRISS